MSLFGEESYEDQEPPSMQLGPVWAPSWLSTEATSSPSASVNDAKPPSALASQMAGPVKSQQSRNPNLGEDAYQQQHPQQWRDAPATAAADTAMQKADAASPLGNSWAGMAQQEHAELTEPAETASDFGSFTAGSPPGYSPTMLPGLTVPASHPFAQHTAGAYNTAPSDSVMSPTDRMHAFSQAPNVDWTHRMEGSPKKAASVPSGSPHVHRQGSTEMRPAAAAAHDSVLQSINRSVPISLDAFGAEDVADAKLDLPSQPDTTVTPPFQGQSQGQSYAASGTPFPASVLQSAVQSQTAVDSDQHGYADWDASDWQGGDIALPADSQAAVPGFSATWPSVLGASAGPNQQQPAADERFSASGPVVFEAVAGITVLLHGTRHKFATS